MYLLLIKSGLLHFFKSKIPDIHWKNNMEYQRSKSSHVDVTIMSQMITNIINTTGTLQIEKKSGIQ